VISFIVGWSPSLIRGVTAECYFNRFDMAPV